MSGALRIFRGQVPRRARVCLEPGLSAEGERVAEVWGLGAGAIAPAPRSPDRKGLVIPSDSLTGETHTGYRGWHVDWMTCHQQHVEAPDFGDVVRVDYDLDTGVQTRSVVTGASVYQPLDDNVPSKASHLRVRSWGGIVEVSGNPSKWGRPEALAGGVDLDGAFEVYNRVLASLGLPPFTRDRWLTGDEAASEVVREGARISRLDLAQCVVCGSPEGRSAVLDWLPTMPQGRRGHRWRVPHEGYAQVGTKSRWLLVCYDKASEIRDALSSWRRSGGKDSEIAAYLRDVAEWAESVGLLRWELRLGSKWLSENGANRWADWHQGREEQIMGELAKFPESPGGALRWEGLFEQLVSSGMSATKARQRLGAVRLWMDGGEPFPGLSRASRYRYISEIREALGLDLRERCNVRALGIRVTREVRVAPLLELPDWYRQAA